MGKLFYAAAVATAASALALAAQAMPQPEPDARLIPVKVEQVTAAAHVTYRDADHHALIDSSLVMVGEAPALDGGCRMRDSAQDAVPGAPKSPTTTPRAPTRDDAPPVRPRGHWTACS